MKLCFKQTPIITLAVLLSVFLLVACAKPPVAQMAKTRQALKDAVAAGAPEKAPDLYNTADELLEQAESEMRRERYEGAKLSAELAEKKARMAIEKAQATPKPSTPAAPVP